MDQKYKFEKCSLPLNVYVSYFAYAHFVIKLILVGCLCSVFSLVETIHLLQLQMARSHIKMLSQTPTLTHFKGRGMIRVLCRSMQSHI